MTTTTAKQKPVTKPQSGKKEAPVTLQKGQSGKEQKTEQVKSTEPIKEKEEANPTVSEKEESVTGRDFTQYIFEGVQRSKSRTLLAIISKYVQDHPETTIKKLREKFPDSLLKSYGVFQPVKEAEKKPQRFFLKEQERIKLADGEVAVCNQVSTVILVPVIMIAKDLGYKVKKSE